MKILLDYYICVYVNIYIYEFCLHAYKLYVHSVSTESRKKAVRSPVTGAMNSCELQCVCWK